MSYLASLARQTGLGSRGAPDDARAAPAFVATDPARGIELDAANAAPSADAEATGGAVESGAPDAQPLTAVPPAATASTAPAVETPSPADARPPVWAGRPTALRDAAPWAAVAEVDAGTSIAPTALIADDDPTATPLALAVEHSEPPLARAERAPIRDTPLAAARLAEVRRWVRETPSPEELAAGAPVAAQLRAEAVMVERRAAVRGDHGSHAPPARADVDQLELSIGSIHVTLEAPPAAPPALAPPPPAPTLASRPAEAGPWHLRRHYLRP